jgi:hypothetical protein
MNQLLQTFGVLDRSQTGVWKILVVLEGNSHTTKWEMQKTHQPSITREVGG